MIRAIEALNFRCLRYIRQDLDNFHVLVGPNASGKTTFLDVVEFLGDLVSGGVERAVENRTQDFRDLIWRRRKGGFDLALELAIPDGIRRRLPGTGFRHVRYEVSIGQETEDAEISILGERAILTKGVRKRANPGRTLFPLEYEAPQTLMSPRIVKDTKTVLNKVAGGNDNFYDETDKGWDHAFKLGPRKSTLGNLPEDESRFPVATWLKGILSDGIQKLILNSTLMRRPSPPGQPKRFRPDGSNLPWVVENLKMDQPQQHRAWVEHLQTALPDLEDVRTIQRPEDRHRYLMICYRDGLEVPSWTASDGTLRLLALTLPAYLTDLTGIYLIEEPENGIHPAAIETAFQSLSSTYGAQILLATHSPVILSLAEASQVLCFAKTETGAADIVRGSEHPKLKDWQGDPNLSVLFAGGVLG